MLAAGTGVAQTQQGVLASLIQAGNRKAALEMITSGRHVPAEEAHRLGIVDTLAGEGKLKETAIEIP